VRLQEDWNGGWLLATVDGFPGVDEGRLMPFAPRSAISNPSGKTRNPPKRSRTPSLGMPSLHVRGICAALAAQYGNPRHGNKSNPLDELAYIILSTRTRNETFRDTYLQVKRAFPRWHDLRPGDLSRLSQILIPAGLGNLKARQLLEIAERLRKDFGRATLSPLKDLSDADAEAYLTSLPGVGSKVAKCVLMYSMGRHVLPVDAHVHRLASRLGFRTKRRPDTSQELIENAVPPRLRYGFHVNAVAHGRTVCLPQRPRCGSCCVARWCQYNAGRLT